MATLTVPDKKLFTMDEALLKLSEGLEEQTSIKVGSFWEFVRDIWSQGYDHPEYFNAWHIGLLCEDVQDALAIKKNYVAILPRFHFKSTILGHAFSVWCLLRGKGDTDVLYMSYSDGMSQRHIQEINKVVRRVPQLQEWMTNRSPNADYSFRYFAGNGAKEIMHGGLFSFKRGLHVNGALIADDLLRDPDNPLNTTVLSKIEDHFMTETMFIPTPGIPVIVMGTPMLPNDLLAKLRDDDRFVYRFLPVFDPAPDRKVLMPELYDEVWLKSQQKARPKSFASEFLLAPYLSTETYFSDAEIEAVENKTLKSLDPYKKWILESDFTTAGFDIGKKRHPSHLSIYISLGYKMTQVCQIFLDGWSYTKQIQLLNAVVENFDIDKGYVDNTRGEVDERGLKEEWIPMTFTEKSKRTMAQRFEEYVYNKKIELIASERQRSQITCVDNELKAPVTPAGHGDAFFSNAMAVLAHSEYVGKGTEDVGDLQSIAQSIDNLDVQDDVAKIMSKVYNFKSEPLIIGFCPNCNEKGGWINENKLCLLCLYRG